MPGMSRGTSTTTTTTKTRARRDDPKPSRRQETLRVTSEVAQAALRRAQQCFLSMIEGPVEPQVFVAKARYINPEVYSDVVVERAVAGLCGYPVCPNTFTDTYGSRTYIIRSNKLYDITERRNFCSNVCYEASELVRKQVLTLPLYLRNTDDSDMKDVCLPNLSRLKGRHGELVDITGGINKIEMDEDEKPNRKMAFKSVDDIARESLVNWSENNAEGSAGDKDSHSEEKETCEREPKEDAKEIQKQETKEDAKKTQKQETQNDTKETLEVQDDTKDKTVVSPLADVLEVERVMREWVSFDSLRVVLGDQYLRAMLEHIGHSWDSCNTTSGMRLSMEAKARYIAICRRLEHDERQEEAGQDTRDEGPGKQAQPSKPLPDYKQLQRDAKKQQLRVVSFLGGSDQYEEAGEALDTISEETEDGTQPSTKRKTKSKKQLQDSNTREPTLPFVDSYSQVAWRQNIVLEKVTTYLQQMLEMTELSVHEIKKLLGPLVATFHLSPSNISFQPMQWRLVTLILLKLLSVRYLIIQDALRTEEGLSMQRTILSAYTLDLNYTDRVLSYLTEIQHVLSKDFKDQTSAAESDKTDSDVPLQACPGGALQDDTARESIERAQNC